MALDEPSNDDEKVECDGITVVAAKDLISQFGGVSIDFKEHAWGGGGFMVRPANKSDNACGDCSC